MKMLHRLNAAQYYVWAIRKLTNQLFGQALNDVIFGNNMERTTFIFT